MHIEVKDDASVWLRCDATDLEIGETLIQKGIGRADIIPAFFSSNAAICGKPLVTDEAYQ